jgi:hypothetical protein
MLHGSGFTSFVIIWVLLNASGAKFKTLFSSIFKISQTAMQTLFCIHKIYTLMWVGL